MPFPFAFARLNALQTAVRHPHSVDSCYPVGLKPDSGAQGSVLDATEKKNESSSLTETCNNILSLSDQLRFWTSKITVRDGNEHIDVSSAARSELSTIPIGST